VPLKVKAKACNSRRRRLSMAASMSVRGPAPPLPSIQSLLIRPPSPDGVAHPSLL